MSAGKICVIKPVLPTVRELVAVRAVDVLRPAIGRLVAAGFRRPWKPETEKPIVPRHKPRAQAKKICFIEFRISKKLAK